MKEKIVKLIKKHFSVDVEPKEKENHHLIYFFEKTNQTKCFIKVYSDKWVLVQYQTYKKGLPLGNSSVCKDVKSVETEIKKLKP